MSKRDWLLFVDDIIESIQKIETYISPLGHDDFMADPKTNDAVVRNLEIIGEATKNIPEDVKKKFGGVNWKGMAGLRDRIIHHYFGIDMELIWFIITNELVPLKDQLEIVK